MAAEVIRTMSGRLYVHNPQTGLTKAQADARPDLLTAALAEQHRAFAEGEWRAWCDRLGIEQAPTSGLAALPVGEQVYAAYASATGARR